MIRSTFLPLINALLIALLLVGCSQPSDEPSPAPAVKIVASPTSAPSKPVDPVDTPTPEPTATHTPVPTSTPATEPSSTPTVKPTNTPTSEPTATPTLTPTNSSTPEPTATSTPRPISTPTATPENTPTPKPTTPPTVAPTDTPAPEPTPLPTATHENTPTPEPTTTPETAADIPSETDPVHLKRGFSSENGVLSPYVKPTEMDGTGRKLLAIYMVGSDLEDDGWAGTIDLEELIAGYDALEDKIVEVVVAFGGASKDGWRGMKIANMSQIISDYEDGEFGNDSGEEAYLYRADGAHMGDQSSLELFIDYLRDGYANFDQSFLTFWDHGNGYKGFGNDSNFNGDDLSMTEMASAFQNSQPGTFDLIGFDACLMATMEVAKVIEPHADYMIASEELEPGHGWLWSAVISAYAEEESIVDTGRRMVDNFVQDVHGEEIDGKTLSLLDLSRYDDLVVALNPVLSDYSTQIDVDAEYSSSLIHATSNVRAYGEEEQSDKRASIDLKHFAHLLNEETSDADISRQLTELMNTIDSFVVHSNHDGTRPNSFGIAIDDPNNIDADYSAYMISEAWLEFESSWADFRQGDADSPEIIEVIEYTDGTYAIIHDDNLAYVSTIYGFVEEIRYEDGTFEDFFMVIAEQPAESTETQDQYFAPAWDQIWFTVQYDPRYETAWIPAFFDGVYEDGGETYMMYTSEIDYAQAGKDYSRYELPYDSATLSIIVDQEWQIVDHQVHTYKTLYSGQDDEIGYIQYDKATYRIGAGDSIGFWRYGFSMQNPANDRWFEDGVFITFVQDPTFQWEFLEFEDQFGQIVSYNYAIWAEDASGNAVITDPVTLPRVVDTPYGNMTIIEDYWEYFDVQVPQYWIEIEPDDSIGEIYSAIDPDDQTGTNSVSIVVEDALGTSLEEIGDAYESALFDLWGEVDRYSVETPQGLSAILLEAIDNEAGVSMFIYVFDDGTVFTLTYTFAADQFTNMSELAYYSFNTFTAY